MFKIIPIIILLFIACQDEKKVSIAFYTLDNPAERVVWGADKFS